MKGEESSLGKWFRQILQENIPLFQLSLPFRVRLFNVLALVGGMISLINGISSYANNQDSVILGLNFGIAVLSFVFVVLCIQKWQISVLLCCYDHYDLSCDVPIFIFKSGGYKGGMVSFIFLESYLQSFMLEGKAMFLQHLRKWSYI